jgi:hypothetical protein
VDHCLGPHAVAVGPARSGLLVGLPRRGVDTPGGERHLRDGDSLQRLEQMFFCLLSLASGERKGGRPFRKRGPSDTRRRIRKRRHESVGTADRQGEVFCRQPGLGEAQTGEQPPMPRHREPGSVGWSRTSSKHLTAASYRPATRPENPGKTSTILCAMWAGAFSGT